MLLFPSGTPGSPHLVHLQPERHVLVFVAFATWAVRTSDLHAPDAWKTGLWGRGGVGWCSEVQWRGSGVQSQLLG